MENRCDLFLYFNSIQQIKNSIISMCHWHTLPYVHTRLLKSTVYCTLRVQVHMDKHVPKAPRPHGNRSPCCREWVPEKSTECSPHWKTKHSWRGSTQCFLECDWGLLCENGLGPKNFDRQAPSPDLNQFLGQGEGGWSVICIFFSFSTFHLKYSWFAMFC